MSLYELKEVSFSYEKEPVLKELQLEIREGSFLGLLGPNGSGKTTLLRLLSGALSPQKGNVFFKGQEVSLMEPAERARAMGVVPQEFNLDFPFVLEEVVAMGRYPYLPWWGALGAMDQEKIEEALYITGLERLRKRTINRLSGGERQRGVIARALAQDPQVLLLDEPVSNLDIRYQQEVFELLARLNHDRDLTIILVSHDLNLAAQYCSELALLSQGSIKAMGSPKKVLQAGLVESTYGVAVEVAENALTGRPQVSLLPHRARAAGEIENGPWVHVIGGGGSAQQILYGLKRWGFRASLGVVNAGDTDAEVARRLDIPRVLEAPFSAISAGAREANEKYIEQADFLLIADVPFGGGNMVNLELALEAARRGCRVLRIKGKKIEERDYTGGSAAWLWEVLGSLGAIDIELEEVFNHLKGGIEGE